MDPIRQFRFRSFKWHCDVRFYADRVESTWDEWGLGVEKGSRSILKEKLQPTLTESATFGFRARGSFVRAAQFVGVAAAIWVFAPEDWRVWAWLSITLAVLPIIVGLRRLRKGAWLNLQTLEGTVALALEVTEWAPQEIAAFKEFFTAWMNEPPKSPQRNAGAGPAISDEASATHRASSFEKTACANPPRG